jgi:hypothetical protein
VGEGSSDQWIWVNKWDEHQSFQVKRGKPWTPPWIKLYPQLLVDYDFTSLPWQSQLLLLKVFMAFAQTRGRLSADTRQLSHHLSQRVTRAQLVSLNDAGWIDICSRTVLERRRDAFWNRSVLEGEEKRREEEPVRDVVVIAPVETVDNSVNGSRATKLEDMPL